MMQSRSYRMAFFAAIMLHLSVVILLLAEHKSDRPVLTREAKNEAGHASPDAVAPQAQAIKAVTVDSQEVMATVNRLKQERVQREQAELNRQRVLNQQAALARKQRIDEQHQLEKIKNEAAKLAVARQKQIAEEQLHLKQLALQKQEQEKHLAEMKQQQETLKLAEIKQKKIAEQLQTQQANAEKVKAELLKKQQEAAAQQLKADLAQKQQAAAQQAALDAAQNARVAGEVDKYKAMILNAISRQWILPENANSSMSSQFHIRLAPNGAVLEVSLTRSSGDPILDRSAQSAIYKASPLPVPTDVTTFNLFRDISLTVRPVNSRG